MSKYDKIVDALWPPLTAALLVCVLLNAFDLTNTGLNRTAVQDAFALTAIAGLFWTLVSAIALGLVASRKPWQATGDVWMVTVYTMFAAACSFALMAVWFYLTALAFCAICAVLVPLLLSEAETIQDGLDEEQSWFLRKMLLPAGMLTGFAVARHTGRGDIGILILAVFLIIQLFWTVWKWPNESAQTA